MAPSVISDLDLTRAEFALSPSGRWVAVLEKNSRLVLLDLSRDPPTRYWLQHDSKLNPNGELTFGATDLTFSPDGRWLAGVVGSDIEFWPIPLGATSLPSFSISVGEYEMNHLAFSADGHWLATTSDAVVRLWDIASDRPGGKALELLGHGGIVNEVVFSPNGRWLAAASGKYVSLWALSPDDLAEFACKIAGRNLTDQEWSQYLGGNLRINLCSDRETAGPSIKVLVTPSAIPTATTAAITTPQPTEAAVFLSPLAQPYSPLAAPARTH